MILAAGTVFPVLVLDGQDGWEALLSLTSDYLDIAGLNRLLPVLNGRCRSVIVEREYIDKDYRDTFANFHAKRFSTPPSRCVRLHFFENEFRAEDFEWGRCFHENNPYLGYVVVRATRPNCLGRTFLSDSLRADRDSHLCLCDEKVQILGEKLTIRGFPFISQDTDATVCAESSLWMVLRYLSNRYSNYSETLPFQITRLASNHALGGRVFPSAGLYPWQLAEALRLRDVSPLIYGRAEFGDKFDHLLYTYIESGFPVLTTVDGHVFVAMGHRSDFSDPGAAVARPAFRYTSAFNRSLTIFDDNKFPYQSLTQSAALATPNCSAYHFADIQDFIVPLPEKVFLPAESAQLAVENVLNNPEIGLDALAPSLTGQDITLRLFLTTGRSFKAKLRQRGMGNSTVAKMYRQIPLPHFIWVCEISLTNEYVSDFMVRGEILWDATRNAYEPSGLLALHYPEKFILDSGSIFNEPQRLESLDLPTSEPYPLFQSNLNPLPTWPHTTT